MDAMTREGDQRWPAREDDDNGNKEVNGDDDQFEYGWSCLRVNPFV